MLEAAGYRRSLFEFMAATLGNPSILVDADLDEQSTVIDAGAYVGEWSAEIVSRYGSHVIAFEPAPMYFAEMQKRLASTPEVTCVPVGLGNRDSRSVLTVDGPGSRIVTGEESTRTVEVEIRDVASILTQCNVERVHLMKLNIEGGEFDVLERLAETGWFDRIDDLIVQFHEWHPGAPLRRRRIRRALARTHQEIWNYPWVWERWARRS